MAFGQQSTYEVLEERLPYSKMVFPDRLTDMFKYTIWRLYTPFHPYLRDACIYLGIVSHVGRQDYLIGHIAENETIKSVIDHLVSEGYGNHFIAWKDDGECVSLRKVVGFKYQYHIRLFKDGEVRAHYEYTPECYPILHIKSIGQEDRYTEFARILDQKINPARK